MAAVAAKVSCFYPSMFIVVFVFCFNICFHLYSLSLPDSLSSFNQEDEIEMEKIEEGLARARFAIHNAVRTRSYYTAYGNASFIPQGSIYKNAFEFHRSHVEMEKRFKVWIYKESGPPLFHTGPMKDIYSIEGQFIDEMESGESPFKAQSPDEAHVFFIPVSVSKIITYLYNPLVTYNRRFLQEVVGDYIDVVSEKYVYWNRSAGADHFYVGCHDWAPDISSADPKRFKNLIRALCNANMSEGFRPSRDVALPEIKVPYSVLGPPLIDRSPLDRPILAFFAGGPHGHVRRALFRHWKDKDADVQVHEYLPKGENYFQLMGKSKFCLCPSGYEVASPRLVESINAGCVPMIISDNYSLPFAEVLDWNQFSVEIPVARIPEIKTILQGIPVKEYLEKQEKVTMVRRHFALHRPAKPFDLLYMVFHSIWLRRLNVRL